MSTATTHPSTRPTTRTDHVTELVPLSATDGVPLTLLHVTGRDAPSRGPVLLLHGAGVRAELFRPPLARTLVDVLLDEGWDVWLGNWRASIDLEPRPWTLDDAAVHDHPALVREVLARTGADTLRAFVHCQGSTTFMISLAAGLLPQVEVVVSNAVSLHPVVPTWSRLKITRIAPLAGRLTPSLSPGWGVRRRGFLPAAVTRCVGLTHRECDNDVCKLVSFTYGSGRPALWSHRNLDPRTHEWLRGEFGEVPFTFFAQMARSVRAGQVVSDHPALPARSAGQAPRTDARVVFLAGEDNRCFLPGAQQDTFDHFDAHHPGFHTVHRLPGYGHLDVLIGKDAAVDTYPLIAQELSS